MKKIICQLPVIPVRASAQHASEMTSQLLFGETATIISVAKEWLQVSADWDGYEGWVHSSQARLMSDDEWQVTEDSMKSVLLDMTFDTRDKGHLVRGATIHNIPNDFAQTDPALSSASVKPLNERATREEIISYAMDYLNSPYLWGGRSPFGIDCSGFTQVIFKLAAVRLRRDTGQQVMQGEAVHLLSDAAPADLAFFDDEEGRIVHTGILISNEEIIHASGKVRIDTIDHQGIFNKEAGEYTHKLRTIRNVYDRGN